MNKPCPKCGSTLIGQVLGIFWGIDNAPHHVSYNCPCGDTRGIRWADAPEQLRHEAIEQYRLSLALEGMI